jgi:hypothetical protein
MRILTREYQILYIFVQKGEHTNKYRVGIREQKKKQKAKQKNPMFRVKKLAYTREYAISEHNTELQPFQVCSII